MAKDHTDGDAAKGDLTRENAEKSSPTEGDDATTDVSRRSAIKLAGLGATAGLGSSLFSRSASAATVYDAVEDLGWDPTGEEPVQNSLADAYGSNVTIQVPPGTYRISGTAFVRGSASNFTLEGTGDDHREVQFVADKGFHDTLLDVRGGAGPHTFRNFSIQQHDDLETSVNMIVKVEDGLLIEDVEHLGFTPEDGDSSAGKQLSLAVTSRSGTGVVRRYYNREGGQVDTYPDRQIGIWVGGAHSGTLTFQDLVLIELGGSCIYASRHSGTVRVEGGFFANNDHHDMRISNERGDQMGWVRGAVFLGDYSLVNFSKANAHEGGEGTWIEHGDGPVLVEDCDYWYRDPYPTKYQSGYTHFPGVIQIPDYNGDVTVRNCRLCNDVTEQSQVTGPTIAAGGLSASLTVEGCSLTGVSPRSAVVANSGVVRDSVIEMPNGGDVRGGISTNNVSASGADGPSLGAISAVYPGHDSIEGEGDSGNWNSEDEYSNTIELVGTGTSTNYEVTVSQDLSPTYYTIEARDEVAGSTATGYVTEPSERDAFYFNGEVTDMTFHEGAADVYVNGQQVDPAARWGAESGTEAPSFEHTIELVGTGTTTNYEVTVSEDLQGTDDSVEAWDSISGSTVNGYVTEPSDRDAFEFNGEVTDMTFHEGAADVYVDGSQIDPASRWGTNSGSDTVDSTLELVGTGTTTNYEVTVSDAIQGTDDSLEPWDDVSAASANGYVTETSDRDAFVFSGDLTDVTFHEGEAEVYVDGSQVDPATVGGSGGGSDDGSTDDGTSDDSTDDGSTDDGSTDDGSSDGSTNDGSTDDTLTSNTITIDGQGTLTAYELTVSGELQKSSAMDATQDDGDTVEGGTATGAVGSGRDSYDYTGDVTDLAVDGYVRVYVNGEQVDPDAIWGATTEHTLEVVGTGVTTDYEISVSGDVRGTDDSVEPWDAVSESTANGYVTEPSDRDAFVFTGDVTDVTFHEGEAEIYVDGQQVDPATFDLPHRVLFDGTGTASESSYEFAVTGELRDDPLLGAPEGDDQLDASGVTAAVGDDVDAYRFAGDLARLRLEGDANVVFDEEA
jgi:hypothetical protein